MYNIHIHTFRDVDVPDKFLPLGLVKVLRTKVGMKIFGEILKNINPFTDDDDMDKMLKFLKAGKKSTQKEIFDNCAKYYPSDARFVVLPMDMAFMGAGKVERDYITQINELIELGKKDIRVIPFMHVDPRRPDVASRLAAYIHLGIQGVKLYTSLGYYPYDVKMDEVYNICEVNNIPVMAHCSPRNPVHFKGDKKELRTLLAKGHGEIEYFGKKKDLCAQFTNPKNYIEVLKTHPNLRICLAHMGSMSEWDTFIHEPDKDNWLKLIIDMCKTYPNLYTDCSFTLADKKYTDLFKVLLADEVLRKKILFGSDYYMNIAETDERRFSIGLRADIGEENWKQITETNAKNYLYGSIG